MDWTHIRILARYEVRTPDFSSPRTKETVVNLKAEIDYILYRLQELGEEPDRIKIYRERIERYLDELKNR